MAQIVGRFCGLAFSHLAIDISGGKDTGCRLRRPFSFGHDHLPGNGWVRSLPLACTTPRTPLSRCQTAQEDKIYSRSLTRVFSIQQ
jgi:hypothetical protein